MDFRQIDAFAEGGSHYYIRWGSRLLSKNNLVGFLYNVILENAQSRRSSSPCCVAFEPVLISALRNDEEIGELNDTKDVEGSVVMLCLSPASDTSDSTIAIFVSRLILCDLISLWGLKLHV